MQVRLKPYHKNIYKVNSLLILGETIQEWIAAISLLNIDLQLVKVYAVPGSKANSLYGCIVFFGDNPLPNDIRNHQYLQYAEDKLLLPLQSCYVPSVDGDELKMLEPGRRILLHPVVGTVILAEAVNWNALLEFQKPLSAEIRKPVSGINIPGTVNAFMLELSDEKLMKDLLNPPSEQEMLENLPFDIKKLMKGNKREMQKYLKYLEQNPDKALDIALPLDVLGSFRGDNSGRFSFSGNWFQRIFPRSAGNSGDGGSYTDTGSGGYWWIGVMVIVFIRFMTCNLVDKKEQGYLSDVKITYVKQPTVIDSHYKAIMVYRKIVALSTLNSASDSPKKEIENYRHAEKMNEELGKKIKDSLVIVYTNIAGRKTDSVVKRWKKSAADSIKKTTGNENFKKQLQDAIKVKREQTYEDYAKYYGLIEDSSLLAQNHNRETAQPVFPEKDNEPKRISIGSILMLITVLIGISLFLVLWRAPQTRDGKFDAGQGEASPGEMIVMLVVLVITMVYILKPLLETYGFGWLATLVSVVLLGLLYRLFGRGLTIFNFKKRK
ncbi:MAG: hypothetical protein QM687_00345 [Ferruginibacter sp.]